MKLFEPIQINSMRLENRIVLTAMVTRLSGEDGFVNQDIHDRYIRFAKGEPGLIVVEAMAVHGAKSGPLLRLSADEFIPPLRALAREVHDLSPSKIVPQIIHFLKIARSGWRQRISDLKKEELQAIVENYGAAARRAREAEFDGVELHMAHAYTMSSFLSRMNKRADEYGKTLENRMRLMSEVINAVRTQVGKDFPIGVRFDGEECIKNGYTTVDSCEIALRMAELGVDYISTSAGGKFEDAMHKPGEPLYPYTGYSGDRCMPGASYQDGANVYIADAIKHYINAKGFATPVVTTGKIVHSNLAESILQEGRADLIGMARALLADPDWPRKVREGREDQVVKCVYGNICKNLDENFKKVVCVLWPKGELQAPLSYDREAPRWADEGAELTAREMIGQIYLEWNAATDNEAIYGYEIFRREDDGDYARLHAIKRTHFYDTQVVGGRSYSYYVQAYDLAGNRSEKSNEATAQLSRLEAATNTAS
ncbi:MAG: NADH:flavin oxidoreductase [Acidobacteria bacterium]|nr:NADH:flavin oxidoreductase [Acidobacteriota bacterium]